MLYTQKQINFNIITTNSNSNNNNKRIGLIYSLPLFCIQLYYACARYHSTFVFITFSVSTDTRIYFTKSSNKTTMKKNVTNHKHTSRSAIDINFWFFWKTIGMIFQIPSHSMFENQMKIANIFVRCWKFLFCIRYHPTTFTFHIQFLFCFRLFVCWVLCIWIIFFHMDQC